MATGYPPQGGYQPQQMGGQYGAPPTNPAQYQPTGPQPTMNFGAPQQQPQSHPSHPNQPQQQSQTTQFNKPPAFFSPPTGAPQAYQTPGQPPQQQPPQPHPQQPNGPQSQPQQPGFNPINNRPPNFAPTNNGPTPPTANGQFQSTPTNPAFNRPPVMNLPPPQIPPPQSTNSFNQPPPPVGFQQQQPQPNPANLPNRFPLPPPVTVPPPQVSAQHQEQVVFNQVQPIRPFEDNHSPAHHQQSQQQYQPQQLNQSQPPPQNGYSPQRPPTQPPQQQQLGQPGMSQFPPQQQQFQQPQGQQFNQQMPIHSQQNGHYPPYNPNSMLQPPPQQQQFQQQQQQQYYEQQQQQQQMQNGYGLQSPTNAGGMTPGGGNRANKRVDKIDPKQIPRRQEVQPAVGTSVRYHTRSMQLPPTATADFICVDEGNCSPRFIRLTTNNIAHESELIDSTKLCIGAIIQPLANLGDGEDPIPIVHYPKGPLRCSKCKAYVNPFFQFVDQGASFVCNLCGIKNDVPDDYRSHLDANGFRRDRLERPELYRGSVEFEVGSEFIARPVQDPVYLFVIDVSYGAVVSGLVGAAVTAVRAAIDQMATLNPLDGSENRLRVGIITYDQSVHYYSCKPPRTEPMMLVMSDVDEPFVPCPPEEILVRVAVEENRALLHSTLDMLSSVYERTKVSENLPVFGAAIAAASETLLETGGKILIMQSNLPQFGVGKLEHRDNINLYFTDKEKSLQVPQNAFYQTLATKCAEKAITVDLFVCANGYVDLATVGVLTEKTGGQIFLYPGFNSRKDGLALQRDLFHDVTRTTGYDGIMIVRASAGLKVAEHFGNFYHRNVQEMELATIDADKTFGVRLEHEGKLQDKSEACIQCALLYTTSTGHRRIRVHTISVPVTSVMSNIFRFADLDAIINLSLKQAVRQLLDNTTCTEAQNALTMACIESLYVYRKFCASATSAGQLILPEPLKLLPLCTLGLMKHPLFQDGLAADERSFLFAFVNSMPCYVSVAFVCPRLFNLTAFDPTACVPDESGRVYLPMPLTLSSESVASDGLYLLDDGRYMYLYIGSDLPMPFLEEVFMIKGDGRSTAGQYRIRSMPNNPQHVCSRINVLIGTLRKNKPNFQNLQIISRRPPANQPQTPALQPQSSSGPSPSPTNRGGWETFESLDENLFFSHLIEDSVIKPQDKSSKDKLAPRPPNTMSYIDFLCFIHKRIQAKFRQSQESVNGMA